MSNLTLSFWNNVYDTNITVTLSGIQLQTCYWNIWDLNLNIVKSILPDMSLNITKSKKDSKCDYNFLSSFIYNSTIQHMFGSCINMEASNIFIPVILEPKPSKAAVFNLYNSVAVIAESKFQGIHVEGKREDSVAVLYAKNSQLNLHRSTFLSNSAYSTTIDLSYSTIVVSMCIFHQNQGGWGGAVVVDHSNVSLIKSHFELNEGYQGGAINVQKSSILTVDNCTFHGNKAIGHSKQLSSATRKRPRWEMWSLKSTSSKHVKSSNAKDGSLPEIPFRTPVELSTESQKIGLNIYDPVQALGGAIFGLKHVKITILKSSFIGNTAVGANSHGGAVQLIDGSILQVDHSLFNNNSAYSGGSIDIYNDGSVIIRNSSFVYNAASFAGGAIGASTSSTVYIISSHFEGNAACQGGVIDVELGITVHLINSTFLSNRAHGNKDSLGGVITGYAVNINVQSSVFIGNQADDMGGVICALTNNTIQIEDSVFDTNAASQGGAIFVEFNVIFNMTNTSISNNKATTAGGLTAAFNVSLYMRNCTFENNSARAAGALYVYDNSMLTVEDSVFIRNSAYQQQGAMTLEKLSVGHIMRCNFSANTAPFVSCLASVNSVMNISYVTFTDVTGNVIYLQGSELHMYNSIIHDNVLKNSDPRTDDVYAVIEIKESYALVTKCLVVSNDFSKTDLIHVMTSALHIENSEFRNNSLKSSVTVSSGSLSMKHCIAFSNKASDNGGLISSSDSKIDLINCTCRNISTGGWGGIIYSKSGNISIWNSSFSYNSAAGNGGVISLSSNGYSSLSVINTSFLYNHAGEDGAAIHDKYYGSPMIDIALDTCLFVGNTGKSDSSLYLDQCTYLRTSQSIFSSMDNAASTKQCSIHFDVATFNTDYLSYRTLFHTGNTTLDSTEQDFLQKAISAGVFVIDRREHPQNVTNEETPYATGQFKK